MNYTPERWVIIKIGELYKVFTQEYDYWRVNSGIERYSQDENYYYFYGYSGSCYKCKKGKYGIDNYYCLSILDRIIEKGAEVLDIKDVESKFS